MRVKLKILIDRLRLLPEMNRLWSIVRHVEKSLHIFADSAAIQGRAGFARIVLLTMNVERKHCYLWSILRGLVYADIQD